MLKYNPDFPYPLFSTGSVGGAPDAGPLLLRAGQREHLGPPGVDPRPVRGDPAPCHVLSVRPGAADDRGLHDMSGQHAATAAVGVVRGGG